MVIGPTGFGAFAAGGPGSAGGGDRGGAGGFRATPGAAAGGAPGATGGAVNPAAGFADRFARFLPDPIAAIQQNAVLVHLTDAQSAQLDTISKRFVASRDSLAAIVRAEIQRAGANPDPAVLFSSLRPKIEEGRRQSDLALQAAKGILTPDQWAQLPPDVREPPRGVGPGGAGRRPAQ